MSDNPAIEFAQNCQTMIDEIRVALGDTFFTKGEDVSFIELVPDGWEGPPSAAISYAGLTFFRDQDTGALVVAKPGEVGASYALLKPGMGEAALPWNWGLRMSAN
jgi:hypothetical protein